MSDEMEMMTPEEVADWLRVSTKTIYRWLEDGKLPALRVGRTYRIPRSEVLAMVRRQDDVDDAAQEGGESDAPGI